MRKALLSFVIVSICHFSSGQVITISADRNNLLFMEVENPVKIVAENNSCKSLVLTIDNGTISGTDGYYIIKPQRIGKATITVQLRKNGKLLRKVSVFDFRVRYFLNNSNVQFAIGPCGNYECRLTKEILLGQQYVRGDVIDGGFDAKCGIDKFSVYIYRKDNPALLKNNVGNKISQEIISEFKLLEAGDVLIFRNITADLPDDRKLELTPVMITIL